MIHVKLPDGSVKEVPRGTSAMQIAKSISPRLADAAIVAKLDGNLVDLAKPIERTPSCASSPTAIPRRWKCIGTPPRT